MGKLTARAVLAALAVALAGGTAHAAAAAPAFALRAAPSGFELARGGETIRVTVLRPGVVRVRIDRDGAPAPDESWAALAPSRAARAVVRSCGPACVATAALSVRADLAT
ncbi:MAG: alpha-glucosidase, partial [Gluconacetobacter diazotrophicus]|nr:alpha-glucosidase [Gluconacetobacter diazotrophicus]